MQGIIAVARINFDDDVDKQEQFWKLIEILKGDRDRAYGRLIRFFRIAQKAYGHDQPMTDEQIHAVGLGDMIESGWAVPVTGGYHSVGAKKYFDWYRKKVQNGKLGGRPPDDADDESDQEPIGSPIAPPSANPLAPAPVPAPAAYTKIPDPARARDQGTGPGAGMGLRPGETGAGSGAQEPEPPEDQEYPFSPAHPDEIAEVEWEMEQRERNLREWAEEFGESDSEPAPPEPASNVIQGRFPRAQSVPPAEPAPTPPRAPDPPPPERRVIAPVIPKAVRAPAPGSRPPAPPGSARAIHDAHGAFCGYDYGPPASDMPRGLFAQFYCGSPAAEPQEASA